MSANPFTTELAPEYRARRDGLLSAFPAAHAFLLSLERLCVSDPRFHLGTTKNLHLYVDDRFLCRIIFEKPVALTLSPEPNGIKEGTHRDPGSVFRTLNKVVMDHRGYSAKWAVATEGKVKITPAAPEAFFTGLLEVVGRCVDSS